MVCVVKPEPLIFVAGVHVALCMLNKREGMIQIPQLHHHNWPLKYTSMYTRMQIQYRQA